MYQGAQPLIIVDQFRVYQDSMIKLFRHPPPLPGHRLKEQRHVDECHGHRGGIFCKIHAKRGFNRGISTLRFSIA